MRLFIEQAIIICRQKEKQKNILNESAIPANYLQRDYYH
ncbi:Hypothetical protein ABZS17I87_00038 [Kosakonia cowanii]